MAQVGLLPVVSVPDQIAAPKRQLTLLDSTSIIVGIIIGASIFESSPLIASSTGGPGWMVVAWVMGGVFSLIGALCYAELATAYPQSGGDYVYLTRAMGRPMGFLFAWAQLWVVRPGSVGVMAYVFARYANEIWPIHHPQAMMIYALAAIIVLTLINILGLKQGKWTQNLLTLVKVLGLVAICLAGLFFSAPVAAKVGQASTAQTKWQLAMILIFYAYGGWNEMAYVAAEVRNPRRNIVRSLLLGTGAVTVIYVLVSLAFVRALGYQGMIQSQAVAADVMRLASAHWGGRLISLLVCISALGAVNGMILTGARINYAMGTEHRFYSWLGQWSARRDAPVLSLVLQAGIAATLVVAAAAAEGGFRQLVQFTTPVFWIFFLLVGLSLFVLRFREPHTARPFRVPLYPLVPALFCLSSAFMIHASVSYAWQNRSMAAGWSLVILGVGMVLACLDRPTKGNQPSPERQGTT